MDGAIAARIATHNFYPNYSQFKNDNGLLYDFFGYLIDGTFTDGKFNRRERVNPLEKFLLINYLVLVNVGSQSFDQGLRFLLSLEKYKWDIAG